MVLVMAKYRNFSMLLEEHENVEICELFKSNIVKYYTINLEDIGYKSGDVVALFMENNIDFFALWLGLSKVTIISHVLLLLMF